MLYSCFLSAMLSPGHSRMMAIQKGTVPEGATPPLGMIPPIPHMMLGGSLTATGTPCSDGLAQFV